MTTWDHWYDNDMPDVDPVTESKRIGNWLIEYADKYNGSFISKESADEMEIINSEFTELYEWIAEQWDDIVFKEMERKQEEERKQKERALKEEREKREAAKRTCCQCGRQIAEDEWFVRVSIFDSDEYNSYCASCFIKESNISEIVRIVAGSKTPPEDFDA